MNTAVVNVEEKLFQNRYKVDHGRPHIQIKNPEVCRTQCNKAQACTFVCPALLQGRRQRRRHPDHRRLPGMRQLPDHLL